MNQDAGGVVQPGSILDGKYRVERILGPGGMGMVIAARHLELGEMRYRTLQHCTGRSIEADTRAHEDLHVLE